MPRQIRNLVLQFRYSLLYLSGILVLLLAFPSVGLEASALDEMVENPANSNAVSFRSNADLRK